MIGKFKKTKIKEFVDGNVDLKDQRNLTFREFLNGEIFTRSFVTNQLPFVLYITFLAFLYIGHQYKIESLLSRLTEVNKELRELKSEAITTSSELMFISKQSQVYKRVKEEGLGLEPLSEPPRLLK